MTTIKVPCEDQDMMIFQDLYASPAKSETSSVDIYDGLDMLNLTEQATKQSSPSADCLDLYEEIIAEEGTAKEASLNNLNAEYEQCQKKIKLLINKLKEMQSLNSILQKENQCLKRNISALMKTARVEIKRKDDIIDGLNQKVAYLGNGRNFRPEPLPSTQSTNAVLKDGDYFNMRNKDGYVRKEVSNKVLTYSYSSKNRSEQAHCKTNNSEAISKLSDVGQSKEEVQSQKTALGQKSDIDETKKEIDSEGHNRDRDRWRRTEGHMSTIRTVTDGCNSEVKEKSYGQLTNYERSQDSRNSKSDVNCETGSRKHYSSSHKPSSSKDDVLRESHHLKEKLILHEKSPQKNESKGHERDKTVEHRHRTSEKNNDLHKSKRSHSSSLKNESSHKTSIPDEVNSKRTSEFERKDKLYSGYTDSKNGDTVSKSVRGEDSKSVRGEDSKSVRGEDSKSVRGEDSKSVRGEDSKSVRNIDSKSVRKEDSKSVKDPKPVRNDNSKMVGKQNTNLGRKEGSKSGKNEQLKSGRDEESKSSRKEGSKLDRKEESKLSRNEESKSRKLNNSKLDIIETEPPSTKKKLESDQRSEKKRSRDEKDSQTFMHKPRVHQKEGNLLPQSSHKNRMQDSLHKEETSQNCGKAPTGQEMVNSQKDLKLSFMETLNLTLSPAKNKYRDEEPVISTLPSSEADFSLAATEASSKVCQNAKNEEEFRHQLSKNKPSDLLHSGQMSGSGTQMADDTKSVSVPKPAEYDIAISKEHQPTMTPEEGKAVVEPIQSASDCQQLLLSDKETTSSKDMDNVENESDIIDLDSFIEIDRCSGSESCSENNMTNLADENDGHLKPTDRPTDQTSSLTPNITEIRKGICEPSNSDQCLHDESSVMSMDLNFIRTIPKIISPLKSPARPLVNPYTPEHTAKASAASILTEGVSTSTPNELNKENCKPVNNIESAFPIEISSDEIEEGEIISDEELELEQSSYSKRIPNQTEPVKVTNVKNRPVNPETKLASLAKSNGIISPLKQPVDETEQKAKDYGNLQRKAKDYGHSKQSVLPTQKHKNSPGSCCLDEVINIATPICIQEVLHMLLSIKKLVRKRYMKFKILFPLSQFHRYIEVTTLYYTTLVIKLDWSSLCCSPEKLQRKLCKLIESRLKQLKKNGIVDRIFQQQLIDMKKRLWKFVEEQLDSLFDTLKGAIVTLCDKAKLEHDQEEKRNSNSSTRAHKSTKTQKSQTVSKKCKDKPGTEVRRLDFPCQTEVHTKSQCAGSSSAANKFLNDSLSTTVDKTGFKPCHTSPKSKSCITSPAKPDTSTDCPKELQDSGSLSFNLVSDDHMGDIFKSLLHDSDNLELNTAHESMWLLDTPEKQGTSSLKYDTVSSITELKIPIKVDYSWSSSSPPRIDTFPRPEAVLNPDVFDESCLLEVPSSTSSSRLFSTSDDRLKSYSLLVEDLAVSLTVPSPLKSDSHLSFLKPACALESSSQVTAHYNEDAVLDEEDATEQDIHLTLDSDNSSMSSLANSTDLDGFQCCPSEPMQAVIMEKSNDHFIVKIRRAISSSSPVSDCSSVAETDNAVANKLESTHCPSPDEKLQHEVSDDGMPKTETNLLSKSIVEVSEMSSFLHIQDKSGNFENMKPLVCTSPQTIEFVNGSPDTINQNLAGPDEADVPEVGNVENYFMGCDITVMTSTEKTEWDDDEVGAECVEIPLTDTILSTNAKTAANSQTACAVESVENLAKHECTDSSPNRKKRKLSKEEPSSKRRKISVLPDIEAEIDGQGHDTVEERDKHMTRESLHRKQRTTASKTNVKISSSEHSSSGGISAKNVVKRKGEVVVSWKRDEDRDILLECQKSGPNRKTFLALSSKMNKYPHQVEERFRQLMKLFKKSKSSSS
ncbi:CASP8-associated protein 2 isoform X2 [Hyperolius riggenbachi]|uniref:CASP8-associated protein 2 isoform X2 n=1 Tax=Hyperolius riggenbachi TaxID=752182 RepID=UPI0035A2ADE0